MIFFRWGGLGVCVVSRDRVFEQHGRCAGGLVIFLVGGLGLCVFFVHGFIKIHLIMTAGS